MKSVEYRFKFLSYVFYWKKKLFIENKQENIIKISLRSKGDFSVNEFSRTHFNGGGHTNAAGGKSDLSLQETTHKFETLLKDYKTQLNK